MFAAGEVSGVIGDDAVARSGELAGLRAAHELGFSDTDSRARLQVLETAPSRRAEPTR